LHLPTSDTEVDTGDDSRFLRSTPAWLAASGRWDASMTAGVLGMFRFAVFTNKVYDHVPKKSNRNRGSGGRLVFGDVRNSYL